MTIDEHRIQYLLNQLPAALAAEDAATETVKQIVANAKLAGARWVDIGRAAVTTKRPNGITKQAAQQHWGNNLERDTHDSRDTN